MKATPTFYLNSVPTERTDDQFVWSKANADGGGHGSRRSLGKVVVAVHRLLVAVGYWFLWILRRPSNPIVGRVAFRQLFLDVAATTATVLASAGAIIFHLELYDPQKLMLTFPKYKTILLSAF